MAVIWRICKLLGLLVLTLAAIFLIRTVTFPSMQPQVTKCTPLDTDFIQADSGLKKRFKEAIRFQTVTSGMNQTDLKEITRMHEFLERSFPLIHSSPLITKEVIGGHSLLYMVKGSEPGLAPYMLAAHLDVVPVSNQNWDHPPFEGKEIDGYIYGRGTIDDKHCVMGIMESLEFRLQHKQALKRSLYIAFGHDEEGYGNNGAAVIAQKLEERHMKFDFILDEGTIVAHNVFKGLNTPVGLISVVEKGIVTLNLSVDAVPTGHSSMPTPESNIGILAKALDRIETQRQPIMFGYGPEREQFEYLADEVQFPLRVIVTNLWFFRPLLGWVLTKLGPSTNAFARTTTAVTMINGGFKTNVLPPSAWAIVNHRIHPSQTIAQVMEHDRNVINDNRVRMSVISGTEPSPISSFGEDSFGFQVVAQSIRQVFSPVLVTPSVMIGNTDTRHYWNLADDIYRFAPTIAMGPEDLKRFHGINERISVKNYEKAVNFFYHVMHNADQITLHPSHSHSGEL
ncbi:N-fatty-acyl-amino acid synthase/hydrolase PM20D1-like [Diadema antillarum]|uniref:N-fatty-acyl-amino acid synthase/hydrolase PM20D1-like n=1 Tax=Diadema antillarum TaxID=105358 RepID=UPI003A87B5E2